MNLGIYRVVVLIVQVKKLIYYSLLAVTDHELRGIYSHRSADNTEAEENEEEEAA